MLRVGNRTVLILHSFEDIYFTVPRELSYRLGANWWNHVSGVPELLMHTPEKSKFYQQRDDKALSWKQRIKGPFDPFLSVDIPKLISLLLINRIRPSQEETVALWQYSKLSCYLYPWEKFYMCVYIYIYIYLSIYIYIHICFRFTVQLGYQCLISILYSCQFVFFFILLIWWNAVIDFQILSQHCIQVCNVLYLL